MVSERSGTATLIVEWFQQLAEYTPLSRQNYPLGLILISHSAMNHLLYFGMVIVKIEVRQLQAWKSTNSRYGDEHKVK
jgi:hypothetical protein